MSACDATDPGVGGSSASKPIEGKGISMRKTAIAVALATSALASPALARDGAFYVGAEGGAMIVEDSDLDTATFDGSVDHKYGYDFDGIVGYDFGVFRLEAEGGYRSADPDEFSAPQGFARVGAPYPGGNYDGVRGRTSNLSFMVNALLDFGSDDGINGFVGGGVGVSRTKAKYSIDRSDGPFLNDSDTDFAYQGLAGVRAPLTRNIDAGLKYRFLTQDDVRLTGASGQRIDTRWRSHSLLGSFIFNFGTPEPVAEVIPPAPPPYVAPPPPPPYVPPVAQCNTGPYIVFFELDKSDITPAAASVLDNAIASYRDCGNARVMLAGHTDRSASVRYNLALSQRRNASVQSYMTGRGIPSGVITSEAFGESQPRVPTADGVREPQNRRVEITYGPGSGM